MSGKTIKKVVLVGELLSSILEEGEFDIEDKEMKEVTIEGSNALISKRCLRKIC